MRPVTSTERLIPEGGARIAQVGAQATGAGRPGISPPWSGPRGPRPTNERGTGWARWASPPWPPTGPSAPRLWEGKTRHHQMARADCGALRGGRPGRGGPGGARRNERTPPGREASRRPLGSETVQTLYRRACAAARSAVLRPERPSSAAPPGAPDDRLCQVDRVLPPHSRFGPAGGTSARLWAVLAEYVPYHNVLNACPVGRNRTQPGDQPSCAIMVLAVRAKSSSRDLTVPFWARMSAQVVSQAVAMSL